VTRPRGGRDRGSGTVLILAVVGVTGMAAMLVTTVGMVTVARHRAQSAADLAALAAAGTGAVGGCAEAGQVAVRNGAQMEDCLIDVDGRVRVRVSVRVPGLPGARRAQGRAHAGLAASESTRSEGR
jgi:secretion/DNA translocation related TadE-like protein